MTQIKKILSFLQKTTLSMLDSMIEARQRQVEAYLARSVDLADLERRQREIQKAGIGQLKY
jgi:hypothetical protein